VYKTAIALMPTILVGIVLYPIVKHVFLSHIMIPIVAMGVGGVILVLFERLWKQKESHQGNEEKPITYKQSFVIGCFQILAFVPGVSRSASTIVGGMISGLSRYSANLVCFYYCYSNHVLQLLHMIYPNHR
jgi:undecaprenyl-diphosphatase